MFGQHRLRSNKKLKKLISACGLFSKNYDACTASKTQSDQNYLQRSMHRFGQKLKIYIYHPIVPFKFPPPHATTCGFLRQKNLTPEFCSDGKLSKKINLRRHT
jgi:hypothetical protein